MNNFTDEITDEMIVEMLLKDQSAFGLVQQPHLYQQLRNIIPPSTYYSALLREATVASYQEYCLLRKKKVDLKLVVAGACKKMDGVLLIHLQKIHGVEVINKLR